MSADIIDFTERLNCIPPPEGGRVVYSSEHYAEVREFHPKIALCGRCGKSNHRAHQCPLNKKASSKRDTLRLGD